MKPSFKPNPTAAPEQLLELFEQSWFAGQRPDLAEFFLTVPLTMQTEVLRELVKIDLEFCWLHPESAANRPRHCRLPQRPRLEDYALAYPELGSVDQLPLDMIAEEFRVRVLAGDPVTPEDYRLRFPAHDRSLIGLLNQTRRQLKSDYPRPTNNSKAGEPEISGANLLARLEPTGLLSETQLRVLSKRTESGSKALVSSLVQQRVLTEFQAELACTTRGVPLLIGDYLLVDRLGKGGMGVVYQARHRRMQRVVALKVLAEEFAGSSELIKRFEREVVAAARLLHPNVVAAFDAGEQDGIPFMVMEYVDGLDLATVVRRHGPLTPAEAFACLLQAARGLSYAHAQGVIHRDIKPSNLLLARSGVVKILDLGLARLEKLFFQGADQAVSEEMTGTGTMMGTIDYMSPEQATNTKIADARSDIYSLGCTFYFLLTGKPVYAGDSLIARVLAHREQDPPSLVKVFPDIDPAIEVVFHRMIAKRPDDRFQSSIELQLALQPFQPRDVPAEAVLTRCISEALRLDDVSTVVPNRVPDSHPSSAVGFPNGQPGERAPSDSLCTLLTMVIPFPNGQAGERAPSASDTPQRTASSSEGSAQSNLDSEAVDSPMSVPKPQFGTFLDSAELVRGEFFRESSTGKADRESGGDQEGRVGRRKRLSRLQFLATLIFGSIGIAVASQKWRGWVGGAHPAKPSEIESLLNSLGVTVESPTGPLILARTKVTDADLRHLKQLPDLKILDLSQTGISESGLLHLNSLPNLIALDLENTSVSDAALERIPDLTRLEVLRLGGTLIGDDGLRHLASLNLLKELSLSHTAITNRALVVVGRCADLEQLELEQTNVDDDGLSQLIGLAKLQVLNLTGCVHVSNRGVGFLAQCRGLQKLYLGRTSIDDKGISSLQALTSLKQLWLDHTTVSASSLRDLGLLSSLEWLSLVGTRFSPADVNRLRQQLPNCRMTL